ncbi:MAG: hypothetical protein ACFB11_02265 [Paracoccaceae bacterium]
MADDVVHLIERGRVAIMHRLPQCLAFGEFGENEKCDAILVRVSAVKSSLVPAA